MEEPSSKNSWICPCTYIFTRIPCIPYKICTIPIIYMYKEMLYIQNIELYTLYIHIELISNKDHQMLYKRQVYHIYKLDDAVICTAFCDGWKTFWLMDMCSLPCLLPAFNKINIKITTVCKHSLEKRLVLLLSCRVSQCSIVSMLCKAIINCSNTRLNCNENLKIFLSSLVVTMLNMCFEECNLVHIDHDVSLC
jgi:hypothetical protein